MSSEILCSTPSGVANQKVTGRLLWLQNLALSSMRTTGASSPVRHTFFLESPIVLAIRKMPPTRPSPTTIASHLFLRSSMLRTVDGRGQILERTQVRGGGIGRQRFAVDRADLRLDVVLAE